MCEAAPGTSVQSQSALAWAVPSMVGSWTLYKGRSSIVTMGNTMDWALSAGTGMLVGSVGGSVQVERGKKEGNDRSKGTEAGQRLWLDLSL